MLRISLTVGLLLLSAGLAVAEEKVRATLYKNPGCGCCEKYADYLRANGFVVTSIEAPNMSVIKQTHGVRANLEGCHTTVIGDYVVEGHVPVEAIDRVLSERPAFDGISVVGMPSNSPGMGDPNGQPLDILSFSDGEVAAYMSVTSF